MKRRATRLGVILAVLMVHLAGSAPPASATTVKEGVFVGVAITGPLGYPCTPVRTLDCLGPPTVTTKDPFKTVPTFNVDPAGGNTVGFSFASTNCAKGSVEVKPLGGGYKPTGPALCSITASGVITGYCGLSTAKGVLTLSNHGPPPFDKSRITLDFTWTEVVHTVVITGEVDNTQFIAVVVIIPAPPPPIGSGGNCTNKTGTTISVVGDFRIITKNLLL